MFFSPKILTPDPYRMPPEPMSLFIPHAVIVKGTQHTT